MRMMARAALWLSIPRVLKGEGKMNRDVILLSWKGLLVAVCVSQKGGMPRQFFKHSLQMKLRCAAWKRLSESLEGTRVEIGIKIQPLPFKFVEGK